MIIDAAVMPRPYTGTAGLVTTVTPNEMKLRPGPPPRPRGDWRAVACSGLLRSSATLGNCAAIVVPDLAEVGKAIELCSYQSASLHVADLELDRQRLRADDHDLEGDCQPSGRTRSK